MKKIYLNNFLLSSIGLSFGHDGIWQKDSLSAENSVADQHYPIRSNPLHPLIYTSSSATASDEKVIDIQNLIQGACLVRVKADTNKWLNGKNY